MAQNNILTMNDVLREALDADRRIRGYVRETSTEHTYYFSDLGKCNVFLKLENTQLTGSFKLRGAFNRLLTLTDQEKERGVITASSGNHGAAITYALRILGLKGAIYVPENLARAKLDVLNMYRATLMFHGNDMVTTEKYARKTAEENGQLFISPYNDAKVIGGQGTIGVELKRQIGKIDVVFVPIGGGGLMAGIAGFLKSVDRDIEIIGCQPENSKVMYESIKAGRIVNIESKPTIADGTAGGIEEGSLTFSICRECVDDFVVVTEEEIKDAVRMVLQRFYMLIEGAAALSVAAFIKIKDRYKGKNVVLVLSGKKISLESLVSIICSNQNTHPQT